MKTGIIGLPQVGKTSLFKILTRAKLEDRGYSNPKEVHLGMARVPDERLEKLAALYQPKKTVFATVEYADVAAIGQESLKDAGLLASLRNVDALIHVLRVFDDPSVPLAAPIDPLKEIQDVEFDLMLSDLTQIEKRMERLEKDLKKMRSPELEAEHALLMRAKPQLEAEQPLRAMEMTPEEKKLIRGYMFLSQKARAVRAEYFREHDAGHRPGSGRRKIRPVERSPRGPAPARPPSAARWKRSWPRCRMKKRKNFCRAMDWWKAGCGG